MVYHVSLPFQQIGTCYMYSNLISCMLVLLITGHQALGRPGSND
jgi:hypothetical protein